MRQRLFVARNLRDQESYLTIQRIVLVLDKEPIHAPEIDAWEEVMQVGVKDPARDSFVYIDGESFLAARADIGGDPKEPWLRIAWKYLWTAKDTWLGPEQNLGAIGATYNLTMDPFEKYDMTFNGAVSTRMPTTSPGRYAGMDNGWIASLIYPVVIDFNKSIVKYPNMARFPGGASNDLVPNLQNTKNPVPAMDPAKTPRVGGSGG